MTMTMRRRRRRRRATSLSRKRSLHPEEPLGGAGVLEGGEERSQRHNHKKGILPIRGFRLLTFILRGELVSEQHCSALHRSYL